MARHVHHIVYSSSDPVIPFMVSPSSIASELSTISSRSCDTPWQTYIVALVNVQICVHVSLVGAPYRPRHTWPWLLECQYTLDVVPTHLLTRYRINDGRFDAEKGQRRAPRLGRRYSPHWCDDVRTGFGLPIRLYIVSHESVNPDAHRLTSTT